MDRDERVWTTIVAFVLLLLLGVTVFHGIKIAHLEARLKAVERHQSK